LLFSVLLHSIPGKTIASQSYRASPPRTLTAPAFKKYAKKTLSKELQDQIVCVIASQS
jgi:hypothetical protein